MEKDKIKNAKIGIAGLGGLGSNIAVSLARIGVGKLLLVDFDVVEFSNLNRQYYFLKHIGMYKADALEEVIRNINPEISLEIKKIKINEENVVELFEDVDILVEALDKPEEKAMLVNTFLKNFKDKKIVAASGISGYSSSNLIKTEKVLDNLYISGDGEFNCDTKDLFLAPRVAIVANHQANMVLRLILGEEEV